LEPFLMLFMGLIIGGLVISLYLPIFEMGQIL
jgi:type II secretory pathway component PulF